VTYKWTAERLKYWAKTLTFYGITPEELNALRQSLIVANAFRCNLCGRDMSGKTINLDHDWVTGEIRGVLCWRCNKMLGTYSLAEFRAGVAYLADFPSRRHINIVRPPIYT
jgi:hypothetical protein